MTTRYAGIGGNDGNDGLSWANRKLTLNGVEDSPVVAGDVVYVGAGTCRESLTIDVSGGAGSPIAYIADLTGEHTDGVGGFVRITGSNDDLTATRANCISAASRSYRTFTGFLFDTTTSNLVALTGASGHWTLSDCFIEGIAANSAQISIAGTGTNNTIQRCVLMPSRGNGILISHSSTVDNSGHLIENCLFLGSVGGTQVRITRVGGITIRNCTLTNGGVGVRVDTALTVGQVITVNDCIFSGTATPFQGTVAGEIVEDYNSLWAYTTARTLTNTGAHSIDCPPLFRPVPLLNTGRLEPWLPFSLLPASQVRNRAGSGVAAEDLYGTTRPQETDSDWGAVETLAQPTRNSNAGDSEIKIDGRSYTDILIPVADDQAITLTARVRWDDNANIGSKPQIRLLADYGLEQQTATATGDGSSEETLTIGPVTPQVPNDIGGVMILRLVNRSTHTSAIACYFDDVTVQA